MLARRVGVPRRVHGRGARRRRRGTNGSAAGRAARCEPRPPPDRRTERYELLELVRAFAVDASRRAVGTTGRPRARHRPYFAARHVRQRAPFDGGELARRARRAVARGSREPPGRGPGCDRHRRRRGGAWRSPSGSGRCGSPGCCGRRARSSLTACSTRFSIPGEQEIALVRACAFLDYSADRRSVASAARRRARPSSATRRRWRPRPGTCSARRSTPAIVEEMGRLRPELLALDRRPSTSPKALGWIQYFLALDAYVDGRLRGGGRTRGGQCSSGPSEIGPRVHARKCASGTGLLARSARDGEIRQAELAETRGAHAPAGLPPLAAFALWFVARYAAGVEPLASGRWLAHAARIVDRRSTRTCGRSASCATSRWPCSGSTDLDAAARRHSAARARPGACRGRRVARRAPRRRGRAAGGDRAALDGGRLIGERGRAMPGGFRLRTGARSILFAMKATGSGPRPGAAVALAAGRRVPGQHPTGARLDH